MALSKDLRNALACPKCGGDVKTRGRFLVCINCAKAYPVLENDIPDMVTSDAWTLEKAKKHGFKHNEKL